MDGNTGMGKLSKKLRSQGTVLGTFVLVFWLVEIVDWILLRGALDSFGVKPRVVAGLWGILFAPFLHAGFGHLLANTVPFLVLGWFVMLKNRRDFYFVTAMAAVVSGLGIWLIGPSRSVHLGASGLVFGYFGFLLLRGYFERSLSSILWSILVVIMYGGMLWGLFPQRVGVSWQAHLFGFLGGGMAAYLMSRPKTDVLKIEV